MEAATAGALYAVETVAEGALALAKGLSLSTAPLNATFTKLRAPSLPRSSHTVSVVKDKAYIFGGEISPRKPVDNAMHVVALPPTALSEADYTIIPARSANAGGDIPVARVGHTAAVIDHLIYVFGGRGGPDMKALDEGGRIWVYNTQLNDWSHLDPSPDTPVPGARSYHASAATPYPQAQPAGHGPTPVNTYGTVVIHAGCLSNGGRTTDLWSFDISSRSWAQLPSAPDPSRGGTSVVFVRNRLYRFGGFDGTKEIGGEIDFLDFNTEDQYNDKSGVGLMALSPRGTWQTDAFEPQSNARGKRGNRTGPRDRSVLGLGLVSTGQGREYLLIICGEGEASKNGHEGAGRFFDDVWSYQLKPSTETAAALKDSTRASLLGKDTGETDVVEVNYFAGEGTSGAGVLEHTSGEGGRGLSLGDGKGRRVQERQDKPMGCRGWFAISSMTDISAGSILLWGGVGEENERLGDGWIISVEP